MYNQGSLLTPIQPRTILLGYFVVTHLTWEKAFAITVLFGSGSIKLSSLRRISVKTSSCSMYVIKLRMVGWFCPWNRSIGGEWSWGGAWWWSRRAIQEGLLWSGFRRREQSGRAYRQRCFPEAARNTQRSSASWGENEDIGGDWGEIAFLCYGWINIATTW